MSEKRVYWKSKEGNEAPLNARFFLFPFEGKPIEFGALPRENLNQASQYQGLASISPDRNVWREKVESALLAPLEKLVLARQCRVEYAESINPWHVCAALQKRAVGAALFCLETPEFSLVGASPERLFRREGRTIYVDAMAGTRKQGAELRQELLHSAKDMRENFPVQKFFREALKPFVETPVQFSPLTVHQTAYVQHLYAQGTAQLKSGISDLLLVDHLHPTPALAGYPAKAARHYLKKLEALDRGFYGGVFGWTTEEASDWMVVIRSATIEKNVATLFSGTGIVKGSQADAEWEELDDKLQLFEGILL